MACAEVARTKAKAANVINLIISVLPCELHIAWLTVVTALSSAVTLVFDLLACCGVHHRYFAGIANVSDVRFEAGLKGAPASLGVRAKLLRVIRTGLGVCHLEQHCLAVIGQVLDVRLEAVLDLASSSFAPCRY